MQKITIGLAPNMTIEISSDNVKSLIKDASFWSDLPSECPICKAPLVLYFRDPQDNVYYGQACTGPVTHEANFGINKQEEKGLYYKGDWQVAYDAYQRNGQRPPQNDYASAQQPSHQGHAPAPQSNPIGQSLGDMVTSKQLGMILAITREINMDAEYECKRVKGCDVAELSKRAASDFIEHLQGVQKVGFKVSPAPAPVTAPVTLPDNATGNYEQPPAQASTAPATPHPAPAAHDSNCDCPKCHIPF